MNYVNPCFITFPEVFKILFWKGSAKSIVALLYPIHFGNNISPYWKGSFFILKAVSEIISADTGFIKEVVEDDTVFVYWLVKS